VRRGNRLELYIDGKLEVTSPPFSAPDFDLSNAEPLRIGSGETDCFAGKIREVRIYKRALVPAEIARDRKSGADPGLD